MSRKRKVDLLVALSVAVVLAVAAAASAEVREASRMAEVLAEVDADTLFVTDIDNTLLEPVQMLGSVQWWDHTLRELQRQGKSRRAAAGEAVAVWSKLQPFTRVVPVEADTPARLDALFDRGLLLLAISARPIDLRAVTRRQLHEAGYHLARTRLPAGPFAFAVPQEVRYRDGVLLVDGADKGKALLAFLAEIRLQPKKLVYADDKRVHVDELARAAKSLPGTRFIGFRYGAADLRVKAFDPEIARIQLDVFRRLLSDDEARLLLKRAPLPR